MDKSQEIMSHHKDQHEIFLKQYFAPEDLFMEMPPKWQEIVYKMRTLPELTGQSSGIDFSINISEEGKEYILDIEEIYTEYPVFATKISGLTASIIRLSRKRHLVNRKLNDLFQKYLAACNPSLDAMIKLGRQFIINKPNSYRNELENFSDILLDLYISKAQADVTGFIDMISDEAFLLSQPYNADWTTGIPRISIFPSTGTVYKKSYDLAQILKKTSPRFAKGILLGLLSSVDFDELNLDKKLSHRKIAKEVYDLEAQHKSINTYDKWVVYNCLLRHGYPDDEYWSDLLHNTADLFGQRFTNSNNLMSPFSEIPIATRVAFYAEEGSDIERIALNRLIYLVNNYETKSPDINVHINQIVSILTFCMEPKCDWNSGRNTHFSARNHSELIDIAEEAYFKCIEDVRKFDVYNYLTFLKDQLERPYSKRFSNRITEYYINNFKEYAIKHPEESGQALASICVTFIYGFDQMYTYTDLNIIKIFRSSFPILKKINLKAAMHPEPENREFTGGHYLIPEINKQRVALLTDDDEVSYLKTYEGVIRQV